MKKIILTLFSIILFSTNSFAANHSSSSSAEPLDRMVAIVNNEIITQNQIDQAYKNALAQSARQHITIPNESTAKKEILNQLIFQKLQLQLAERNHINVTDAQINEAIENIAKQHNISVAMLKQKIVEQGASYALYRNEIKKQILMSVIQHQALTKDIQVSDAEINHFLNSNQAQNQSATQYHVIDTLVSLPSAPSATQEKQARSEAMQIAKSLRQGIETHTFKGAETRDLGLRATSDLPDMFLKPLSHMKSGDVSEPIRAPNGYHVLKVVEMKKASINRAEVKNFLMQQKFQKALHDWLVHLREQSYVKIVNPQ